MIELFKVKNFMSFREETFLDMRASVLKQHPDHIIHPKKTFSDSKNGLLKTVAIYGANASGKSNLISALYSMKMFVLSQLYKNTHSTNETFKLEPFLLSDKKDTTEFEIVFRVGEKRLQYGFEIQILNDDIESTFQSIVNEWYLIDDELVFERKENTLEYGSKYKKALKDYQKIPSDRLYISVLDYFLDDSKKEIIEDLIVYFRKHLNIFSVPLIEFPVKWIGGSSSISKRLIDDEKFRSKVTHYLNMIDVGINDLLICEENGIDPKSGEIEKRKTIKTLHTKYSEKGNSDGMAVFSLSKESSGTLRFLTYIQMVIEIQESGGIFVVDELSNKLHPLLTKFLINLFQSKENQSSQLVFTTHDVFQLTKEQFRRDEVVFVDKNEKGESSVTSLAQLKVREDSTFNKDYINGKYGAIPIFKSAFGEEK